MTWEVYHRERSRGGAPRRPGPSSITLRSGGITLSRALLDEMGAPGRARLLWDPDEPTVAVAPTDLDDPDGYAIGHNGQIGAAAFSAHLTALWGPTVIGRWKATHTGHIWQARILRP